VKTVKSNSENENVFKSIFCGNLRKKMAENHTIKSNLVDLHITGPFYNKKSGQSHWVNINVILINYPEIL
jgi:hypothetical protein